MSNIAAMICNVNTVQDNMLDRNETLSLYRVLTEKCLTLCTRFTSVHERLIEGEATFCTLPTSEQRRVLINLLNYFNNVTSRVDLTLIGGPPRAGKIANGFITNLEEEFDIVDQSITGMFERRTHIGL